MHSAILKEANILLPDVADMQKWSVVACDQYTSEPAYWEAVQSFVDGAPSTLSLVFPEIYLEEADADLRIQTIDRTMDDYVKSGILKETGPCFVYVERTLKDGRVRKGLVGMVDLEAYDFAPGAKPPVRATEGTVLERIPPRVKIRKDALLELPHVMLLIDDAKKTVIEPLAQKKAEFTKLYDFDLMMDSGHIAGYQVSKDAANAVHSALDALGDKDAFYKKYGPQTGDVLLFAVGDGNHSLATAKTCYEAVKAEIGEAAAKKLPCRYALTEVVNLHDAALEFEPIHRIVFGVCPEDFFAALKSFYELMPGASEKSFTLILNGKKQDYTIKNPNFNLTVGCIQAFLDDYQKTHDIKVDYIHGADVVESLCGPDTAGILLPGMEKDDLFKTVVLDGVLPRKTFSMGEACDKRFYLESRKIQ